MLASLQAHVGGYLTAIMGSGFTIYAQDDREHANPPLERNELITRYCHERTLIFADDWIAGTAVILGAPNANGYDTAVSSAVRSEIATTLGLV